MEASRNRVSLDDLVVTRRRDVPVFLDYRAVHQVLFHNSARTFLIYLAVPDVLRIDHDHRTMAALIHATGMVDSDITAESCCSDSLLENGVDVQRSVEWTRLSARADEDVVLVLAHSGKMSASVAG